MRIQRNISLHNSNEGTKIKGINETNENISENLNTIKTRTENNSRGQVNTTEQRWSIGAPY